MFFLKHDNNPQIPNNVIESIKKTLQCSQFYFPLKCQIFMNNCVCACVFVRACVHVRVFGIPVSLNTLALNTFTHAQCDLWVLQVRYEKTISCHELMSLILCFSLFGWRYGFKTTKSKKKDHLLSLKEENVYLTDAEIFFFLRRHVNGRISAPVFS